jgi:hypothetical protein
MLSQGLPTMHHTQDKRENYERLKQHINQRNEVWKKSRAAQSFTGANTGFRFGFHVHGWPDSSRRTRQNALPRYRQKQ